VAVFYQLQINTNPGHFDRPLHLNARLCLGQSAPAAPRPHAAL
jgi:hypothetical protein